ncbi:hypothetical protein CHLNCDRAFT_138430 [Chlorella variabilis]|uniref:Peptidase M16 N-terminal domain-containing protein n=1 Tax=Chlorella variabilis TaxID=554065 RepID=E1ZN16_CHLVA|nr:hypothetical protein CHLNCDRAFT_138430 [Chlorella variabilis]EFN52789.1 hypothetical protein CHLNCDRAFT_138430 [Chlorella variabilis]|eukprot:XP_005844891.1 hypothetical protein CHLNCDRAFT_138430 [Chlorella variabilis]
MKATEELLLKSPADKKFYRLCTLDNGLQALLIHDPEINECCQQEEEGGAVQGHAEEASDEEVDSLLSGEDGSEEEEEESSEEEGSDHEHVHRHHGHGHHGNGGAVKKAAAALSVGVGHFTDPWSLQGLSHYLEHMLFMGSERFPDENDYDAFLTAHGGSSNACTEEECTTFHFDVKPDTLRPALDRFAQFFIAPLIKADALDREVQAVDNEFSGVLQSDACRMLQLRCRTAREGHLFRKFGWGNRKSLVEDPATAGIDVRQELLQYYREQYSAERMNLVVLGGEDLDVLQQWVEELFSAVPGGRGPRPQYGHVGPPFHGGRLYLLPAVRDEHRLTATFQLPCLNGKYRKKADEYLAHFVGHEGSGSLLSALKARGWASELSAGVSDQSSVAWLFEVSITLTEAGLAAGPGCGLACVGLLFEFLALLRSVGPQRWAYDELATIAQMRFRFQEEEDAAEYAAGLASNLFFYAPADVLAGQYMFEDWDPALATELLQGMTPDAVRLDLCTRSHEVCAAAVRGWPGAAVGDEPWFNFPYVEAQLPEELRQSWADAIPSLDIALPSRNDYLPTNFDLRCEEQANGGAPAAGAASIGENGAANGQQQLGPAASAAEPGGGLAPDLAVFPSPPALLLDEPGLLVWHKLDASFRQPRTNAYLRLFSAAGYASPRAAALSHLLIKLLEDALCETAYLAEVAGLHYGIWWEGGPGMDFKLYGFSEKLPLLAAFIFRSLAHLQVLPERFVRIKEALLRNYRNVNMSPSKHATYQRLLALKERFWHADQVLPELEGLEASDVTAFLPALLAGLHIEALLHGNIAASEAEALARRLHVTLGGASLAASTRPAERCVQLPKGCTMLNRSRAKNPDEENSVVEAYYQCCADTVQDRALLDMVEQLLYEPCFDTLRTKEQLGYSVHSGTRRTHGVLGLCVVVVSGAHGPAHLDVRIEAFLASFAATLAEMGEEEFEKQRQALLAIKMMKDRTMMEESDRAWDKIASRSYAFHSLRDECTHLRVLTLQQVRDFYNTYLAPGSITRRKLSLHIMGQAHVAELEAQPPAGVQLVEQPQELSRQLPLWPAMLGDAHACN